MKLSESKPYFESSGDMQEHFFSIEDQGMIFDILRSKMYSNPILAICREITSNARDAHREVGKVDVPVVIHLPNGLEPDYTVKDFGPGISPERMLNIFIKYTASTKRNDNIQTGGFGLGAKTPFSYSDQFNVITVHNGIKYDYSCGIDETKVGKLVLMNQVPTDEPNGTEIKIPVKPVDFNLFKQWTEQACRHWDVLPIIKGNVITWTTFTKVIEGEGWAITTNSSDQYNYNNDAKLIIDGIEYPLELSTLRKYADSKLIDSARGDLLMYFGVGQLSLSASREQIYLDKPTQDKIRARLEEIQKDIKKRIDDKVDQFPNLWDANVYHRNELSKAFKNLDFLGQLEWKGHVLNNKGYAYIKCKSFIFTRGKYSRKYGTDPDKLSRSMENMISFDADSQLYVNDLSLKEPTPRHVKKAFDDDPKLKTVQVICPDDKQKETDLNKELSLDQMNPKKLSSITKASSRTYTTGGARLLIFKFDKIDSSFRQVSYDSMDEDTSQKIFCLLSKSSYPEVRTATLKNKRTVSSNTIKSLLEKYPTYAVYGVDSSTDPTRIAEEFSDFQTLDKFVDEKVLKDKSINYVEIKYAYNHNYRLDSLMLKHFDKLSLLIQDKNSLFLNRLNLHNKIKKMSSRDTGLLDIYESINGSITDSDLESFRRKNPDWDVNNINEKYDKKYPLLHSLNTYNFQDIIDHVAHYVNMVDKF